MALQIVDRVGQDFHVTLLKVLLVDGNTAQLGGAHRSEIGRMRKQDTPSARINTTFL